MFLNKRVIPCLLLANGSLVKTKNFKKFVYIGDPANTVRIFNELEVDELILVDIRASLKKTEPNFQIIKEIASECFMPLSYGGGITSLDQIKKILNIGVEKVAINSFSTFNPSIISEAAKTFGSQCIIGSIDVRTSYFGKKSIAINDGTKTLKIDPVDWAIKLENLGAGELLVTSIDRDGTYEGYDKELIDSITKRISIPVIANGGAGDLNHVDYILNKCNASAAGLGSMVVYQKKDMGVLVNFPSKGDLKDII